MWFEGWVQSCVQGQGDVGMVRVNPHKDTNVCVCLSSCIQKLDLGEQLDLIKILEDVWLHQKHGSSEIANG